MRKNFCRLVTRRLGEELCGWPPQNGPRKYENNLCEHSLTVPFTKETPKDNMNKIIYPVYLKSTSFLVPQMFDQSTQEQCAMMVGMYFMQDQPHRLLQPRLFSLLPLLMTPILNPRRSSYLSGEMLIMWHPYRHGLNLFELP